MSARYRRDTDTDDTERLAVPGTGPDDRGRAGRADDRISAASDAARPGRGARPHGAGQHPGGDEFDSGADRPAHARAAATRNVGYLDAPDSGGEKGAAEGTLAILVGGEEAVVDRVRSVLEIVGRPTHIGPVGNGRLAKLVNQLIVAGTITVVAEAVLLAEREGADPATVREAILGGFAHSTVLEQHGLRMIAHDFRPAGPRDISSLKDTATTLVMIWQMSMWCSGRRGGTGYWVRAASEDEAGLLLRFGRLPGRHEGDPPA
jgi:hypothetical protein